MNEAGHRYGSGGVEIGLLLHHDQLTGGREHSHANGGPRAWWGSGGTSVLDSGPCVPVGRTVGGRWSEVRAVAVGVFDGERCAVAVGVFDGGRCDAHIDAVDGGRCVEVAWIDGIRLCKVCAFAVSDDVIVFVHWF